MVPGKVPCACFYSHLGYEEIKEGEKGIMRIGFFSLFQQHDGLRLFKTAIEDQIALENQMMDIYEFEPDGLLEIANILR